MKKRSSISLTFTLALIVLATSVRAQLDVPLILRETYALQIPMVITPFSAVDGNAPADAKALEQIVFSDLEFAGIFKIRRGYPPLAANGDDDGMVELRGALFNSRSEPHFEGRLVDVETGQQIGAKRYKFDKRLSRRIAHHFADEVVHMITGERGVATTKVIYQRRKDDNWEVVMSDYDGYAPKVLVRQSVPIMFPRWVEDDDAFAYTSFRDGKPDLFLRYVREASSRQLASYDGINYSVDWHPGRQDLVATLSKDGNAEIYILKKDGQVRRRLTHSRAIDTSPCWSPSGREVAFTSDRAGVPHLYIMEADGSNVRRLTYHGNYNESPAWSPKGDFIAFASRIDGFFQLCIIRPDGSDLMQVTTVPRNHEEPRWAPNGRHLVFTQEEGGESVISIIDIATKGKRILAQGKNPDWSGR